MFMKKYPNVVNNSYIFCIALWPVLNYINNNFNKINSITDILFLPLILFVVCFVVIKLINIKFKQNISRYLLPLLSLIFMLFSYGSFCDTVGLYVSVPFLKISYLWLLLLCFILHASWKFSVNTEITKIVKVVILVIISLPLFSLCKNYTRSWHTKTNEQYVYVSEDNAFEKIKHFKHKPNIYFILTDAYASNDTLQETTKFNNQLFLDYLAKKGFLIGGNTYSNYHFTVASLSATMNMRLHSKEKNSDYIKYTPQMHESLKGNNVVRRILKSNGYDIINIPACWYEMSCYGYEDYCIRGNGYDIYRSFLSSTPFRIFKLPNQYVDLDGIEVLINKFNDSKPIFLFAHLAQVHDAIYDQNGKKQLPLHPIYSSEKDSKRYIASIKYLNKQLVKLVDFIIQKDPKAVIIIQADHGPTYVGKQKNKNPTYWLSHNDDLRFNSIEEFKYAFGILSAIHLPNYGDRYHEIKESFSLSPTPVNLFRNIFAYLSDVDPNLELDSSYFLYYDKLKDGYNSIDVNFQ